MGLNLLKIDTQTGEISIDDTELVSVSDIQLQISPGDLITATIKFNCEVQGILAIDGHMTWAQEVTTIPDNPSDTRLGERIKSLISMSKNK